MLSKAEVIKFAETESYHKLDSLSKEYKDAEDVVSAAVL